MIRDEESNNYSNDELKNLIKSYIDWEKKKYFYLKMIK